MSYPVMLERVEAIAVMLNAMNNIMPVDRRNLIEERQHLLTKLVAAGIIDNS